MRDVTDVANNLAENVWLRLVSRLAMVAASAIILPLGTWVLSTTYGRIDKQQDSISGLYAANQVLQTKVDLLTQTVEYNAKQATQVAQITQANIDALKVVLAEFNADRYRNKDADRDQRTLDERFRRIEDRLNTLDSRRK